MEKLVKPVIMYRLCYHQIYGVLFFPSVFFIQLDEAAINSFLFCALVSLPCSPSACTQLCSVCLKTFSTLYNYIIL